MFKTMDKKKITILRSKMLLNWHYAIMNLIPNLLFKKRKRKMFKILELCLILARSHTFVEIDHEIISMTILSRFPDSRRAVVIYKRKYVQEVLVKPLSQACPGKKCPS